MVRETIKDFYSRPLGYIETKPNGEKVAYDFYNRILGYYDPVKNITQDFYRKIIARGDALVSLVMQAGGAKK